MVLITLFLLLLLCITGLIMGLVNDISILIAATLTFLVGTVIGIGLVLLTQIPQGVKRKRKGFRKPAQMISRRDMNLQDYSKQSTHIDKNDSERFKSE